MKSPALNPHAAYALNSHAAERLTFGGLQRIFSILGHLHTKVKVRPLEPRFKAQIWNIDFGVPRVANACSFKNILRGLQNPRLSLSLSSRGEGIPGSSPPQTPDPHASIAAGAS